MNLDSHDVLLGAIVGTLAAAVILAVAVLVLVNVSGSVTPLFGGG